MLLDKDDARFSSRVREHGSFLLSSQLHVTIQTLLKSMSISSRCVNKPMDCSITGLPVLLSSASTFLTNFSSNSTIIIQFSFLFIIMFWMISPVFRSDVYTINGDIKYRKFLWCISFSNHYFYGSYIYLISIRKMFFFYWSSTVLNFCESTSQLKRLLKHEVLIFFRYFGWDLRFRSDASMSYIRALRRHGKISWKFSESWCWLTRKLDR